MLHESCKPQIETSRTPSPQLEQLRSERTAFFFTFRRVLRNRAGFLVSWQLHMCYLGKDSCSCLQMHSISIDILHDTGIKSTTVYDVTDVANLPYKDNFVAIEMSNIDEADACSMG